MKLSTKESIMNYLMLLGVIIILLVGSFYILYYFKYQNNECITNPLVFGARQLKDTTGKEVYGEVRFLMPNSPIIKFDSENFSIEK